MTTIHATDHDFDLGCRGCNPTMNNFIRSTRLTSPSIRAITTIAEAWGWTDVTSHYGDPDCDLTQTFEKGNVYAHITWLGRGVHDQVISVEAYTRKELDSPRPDGMLFYSGIGTPHELKAAAATVLTTA